MMREHDEYRELEIERAAAEKERTAHRSDWFVTATGKTAFVLSPDESDIDIVDIAIGLSRICRFGGHLKPEVPFYSVAQHSVLVSHIVPEELALRALLHDAAEAYLGDVIRPLKMVLAPIYKPLEEAWELAIGRRFELGPALAHMHPAIKRADNIALATERRDLVSFGPRPWANRADPLPDRIVPLSPFDARELFMMRFADLWPLHTSRAWVT
jgi:5'-deoxynucleotidase YfbR-like HD superfamily hydrolase